MLLSKIFQSKNTEVKVKQHIFKTILKSRLLVQKKIYTEHWLISADLYPNDEIYLLLK